MVYNTSLMGCKYGQVYQKKMLRYTKTIHILGKCLEVVAKCSFTFRHLHYYIEIGHFF